MNKKFLTVTCLFLALILLSACGLGRKSDATVSSAPEVTVVVTTPAPTPVPTTTPTPTPTPTPMLTLTPTPTPTPVSTPTPTPTPVPISTPSPIPTTNNLPRVTKSPTDETVPVNGKCQFVAKYENAKLAEWHFVSPDGSQDLTYIAAEKEFPTLKVINGYTKDLTLDNIPQGLNGWRVYCRFSNDAGSVDTGRATITVTGDATGAVGAPKVTKSPTGETVNVGGSAWFVAKHEGAIWAVWHFVSPDGTRDITYSDAAAEFRSMQIVGGDQGTMQLKNIPAELNGWKVYCAFRNNVGTVNTDSALITVNQVQPQPQAQTVVPTTQREGFEGRWTGEINTRCRIEITYRGEGSVNVDITWSGSATDRSRWNMTADAYRNDIMIYEDGHHWIETYSDDTHYTVSDETYGGTGSFYLQGGKLHWHNDQTGEDVVLIPAA